MAYPGSRSHTWVAGERVDHDDLNAWAPPNVAWGSVAPTVSTSTQQTGITSTTDITSLTTGAVTLVSGRRYRVELQVTATGTVSTDTVGVNITDGSNNPIAIGRATTGGPEQLSTVAYVTGSGSVTYKGRIERVGGTGTMGTSSAGTHSISITDIGPSTP